MALKTARLVGPFVGVSISAMLLIGDVESQVVVPDGGPRIVETGRKSLDPPRSSSRRMIPTTDPFDLVNSKYLLRYVEDLTAIEPHSGWRSCGSAGERQAFDYVEDRLHRLRFLTRWGLEIEVQDFRTAVGMEFHQSRLVLEVGGVEFEVAADAIAGHPYDLELTSLYDSDGDLTDVTPDPVEAKGETVVIRTPAAINALGEGDLAGRIAIVDFSLIDRIFMSTIDAYDRIAAVFNAGAAGVLLVTEDSVTIGESHGSFALDSSVMSYLQNTPPIPVLVVRLEDLAIAGIDRWGELGNISDARLTWDVDVVMPGESNNLLARIPGNDSSQAVILSAHLDSPNSPGALDNGSGSAALIEVARVLNRARVVPPVDVYLVWFGCHEKGIFGSAHFGVTHQDLLDRTLAMIELDAMARPLDGLEDPVNLESWSYERLGDSSLPLPDFLQDEVGDRGITAVTWDFHWLLSDISGFVPYDVPNALLDNLDLEAYDQLGSYHYMAHWHTPYDVVEHARVESDQFEELTRVLLATALDTGRLQPDLRVTPAPDGRVVFLATHTESVHMTPMLFTDLGTILAWEGLDLDVAPYGDALTASDLEDAAMVVVLPVHDYPSELSDVTAYDESWSGSEIQTLVNYVDGGGLLVLTNSAYRLGPFGRPVESNEDWADMNALAGQFGVEYTEVFAGREAIVNPGHDLVQGVTSLFAIDGNGVELDLNGQTFDSLASVGGSLAAAVSEVGDNGGEVIALADIGVLISMYGDPTNFRFWQNLAAYARER